MKKVLLATTAVVLSAGIASAEISLSGSGRMGLTYNDNPGVGVSKTQINNRFTVNIDGSMETTSGLTFGARMRIRANQGAVAATSGARVYMKTGAFELAVGNINGAIDSMPNLYMSEVGLTALNDAGVVTTVGFDSFASTGAGRNGIEAIYSAGAFAAHLSYSETGPNTISGIPAPALKRAAIAVAYTMNDWTFALGAQDSSMIGEDLLVLTVAGKIGDYGVGFAAADNDGSTKIAINGSATFGATTVNGFVSDDEAGTDTGIGLGVSYDLGGASLMAGVERDNFGTTRADMGVSFSF